jgi:hypothetical protein
MDQRAGHLVRVKAGVDISVFSSGYRNCYDLVLATNGEWYTTDNGPNVGNGPASTGPYTQGGEVGHEDEFIRFFEGSYHGHPNRNRGFDDPRENIYYDNQAPTIPGQFEQV